jgi:predicted nucleic acid-binding protein
MEPGSSASVAPFLRKSILSTDLASSLGRLSHVSPVRRKDDRLPFIEEDSLMPEPVLFDTTVYIDVLHDKFSQHMRQEIGRVEPWHCTVVESELVYLTGRLDPAHPGTAAAVRRIGGVVEHWPSDRVLNPDREIWREAAILTGILSRLHHTKEQDRGRTMNDALIFLTASQHGCAVLSRNVRDFDLLMQLVPAGKAVFYHVN